MGRPKGTHDTKPRKRRFWKNEGQNWENDLSTGETKITEEFISSSFNLLEKLDFYLGYPPPKCGRVPPKPTY